MARARGQGVGVKAKPKAARSPRPPTPARSTASPVAKLKGLTLLASIVDIDVEPIPMSETERSRLRKVRAGWLARWLADDPQLIEHAGREFENVGNAIRAAAQSIPGKPGRRAILTRVLKEHAISAYRVLSESQPNSKITWRYELIASILGQKQSTVRELIKPSKRKGR